MVYWRRMPCSAKKKKLLGEAPLRLVHGSGDVEGEDDRGIRRRRRAAHELAEAQVLVHDGNDVVRASSCTERRLTASFIVRRRSSRERRLSQPSRM